ncbi:GNAT family N-acetyltransferase [Bacillaceae bacterium S4-13-58]
MNKEMLKIAPSSSEDIEQLIHIDHLIWNDKNTPQVSKWESIEEYEKVWPPGSQFVAKLNNRVIGYIMFRYPTPLPSNNHVIELMIGIHPDYQGMGVGRALVQFLKQWAQENGKRKICLRVLSTNGTAIHFYKSNGFEEQGRLKNEFLINGQYVDDILMFCWLDE